KSEPSSKKQRFLQWMRSVIPESRVFLRGGTQVSAPTASPPGTLLENHSGSAHANNPEHASPNQVPSITDSMGA
ncbi:hypothetical protein C0993_001950, partial [Termitomyces sp. T159_Od127]